MPWPWGTPPTTSRCLHRFAGRWRWARRLKRCRPQPTSCPLTLTATPSLRWLKPSCARFPPGADGVQVLGIDLGGSGFRVGVYDVETGHRTEPLLSLEHRASLHPEDVLPHITEVLEERAWSGPMGFGFPGAVVNN